MKITTVQKLAWLYAAMFFVIGSLRYIPFINDASGYTLGIFRLEWYDDLLHYASGVLAALAAWRSFNAATFYFISFGIIYGMDGIVGLLLGQGYLDGGIFLNGITPLDWQFKFLANIPHILIGGIAVFIGLMASRRYARHARS